MGEGVIETTPPTRATPRGSRTGLIAVVVALGALIVGAGVVLTLRAPAEVVQPAVVTPTPVRDPAGPRVAKLLERVTQLEAKPGADDATRAQLSSLRVQLTGAAPGPEALAELEAKVDALERGAQ